MAGGILDVHDRVEIVRVGAVAALSWMTRLHAMNREAEPFPFRLLPLQYSLHVPDLSRLSLWKSLR